MKKVSRRTGICAALLLMLGTMAASNGWSGGPIKLPRDVDPPMTIGDPDGPDNLQVPSIGRRVVVIFTGAGIPVIRVLPPTSHAMSRKIYASRSRNIER